MSLRDRLNQHRHNAGKTAHPVSQWMLHGDCEIHLIEECNTTKRYKRERLWIRRLAKQGADLLNVSHC
jgi:hypothetical protein